jgi:hypothetical protein
MLQATRDGEFLILRAPFHPAFSGRARLLGGQWSGKAWVFPCVREREVREVCLGIFGYEWDTLSSSKLVCVRVEVTVPCAGGPFEQCGTGVYLGGREIARAYRVGHRARPGRGVKFLRKAPVRAGSDEFPMTVIPHGAVFEVRDVPPQAAETLCSEVGAYGAVVIVDPVP